METKSTIIVVKRVVDKYVWNSVHKEMVGKEFQKHIKTACNDNVDMSCPKTTFRNNFPDVFCFGRLFQTPYFQKYPHLCRLNHLPSNQFVDQTCPSQFCFLLGYQAFKKATASHTLAVAMPLWLRMSFLNVCSRSHTAKMLTSLSWRLRSSSRMLHFTAERFSFCFDNVTNTFSQEVFAPPPLLIFNIFFKKIWKTQRTYLL